MFYSLFFTYFIKTLFIQHEMCLFDSKVPHTAGTPLPSCKTLWILCSRVVVQLPMELWVGPYYHGIFLLSDNNLYNLSFFFLLSSTINIALKKTVLLNGLCCIFNKVFFMDQMFDLSYFFICCCQQLSSCYQILSLNSIYMAKILNVCSPAYNM